MLGSIITALVAFTVPASVVKTPLEITAADGIVLAAVEYRADGEVHRRTVIITGDAADGAESSSVDALAEALFGRGLDVVVWSRRGTGESTGRWDFGAADGEDLLAVIDAIDRRTFGHELGLVGVGTGGAISLGAAARTAKAEAVALYGVGIRGVPGLEEGLLTRFFLRLRGVRLGAAGESEPMDMAAMAKRLRRRPVFLSIGGRDDRVTRDEALELYGLLTPPKEWGFAPGAGASPPVDQYAAQAADFFVRRLR